MEFGVVFWFIHRDIFAGTDFWHCETWKDPKASCIWLFPFDLFLSCKNSTCMFTTWSMWKLMKIWISERHVVLVLQFLPIIMPWILYVSTPWLCRVWSVEVQARYSSSEQGCSWHSNTLSHLMLGLGSGGCTIPKISFAQTKYFFALFYLEWQITRTTSLTQSYWLTYTSGSDVLKV